MHGLSSVAALPESLQLSAFSFQPFLVIPKHFNLQQVKLKADS
jgi:hypothetical protein